MGKSPGCYVSPGSFLSLGWGEHNLAGSDLIDRLIHDFEREILLAEAFASREDPMETVYHRTTADMIHKTLKTLESIKK